MRVRMYDNSIEPVTEEQLATLVTLVDDFINASNIHTATFSSVLQHLAATTGLTMQQLKEKNIKSVLKSRAQERAQEVSQAEAASGATPPPTPPSTPPSGPGVPLDSTISVEDAATLRILESHTSPVHARVIARALGAGVEKSVVNRSMYRLLKQHRVLLTKNADGTNPRWMMMAPT